MIKNIGKYTQTIFKADVFAKATGNHYRVVSQAPYLDKKGKAGIQGTMLTLMVIEDSMDYGVDKNTGLPRDNNVMETFDVTILNGQTHLDLKKGDEIALKDYDPEHSYVMDYSLILRYKGYTKIEKKG